MTDTQYDPEELLLLWWHTPSNEGYGPPLLFTGDPGEAKSGFIKYIARKFAVPFLYIDPLAKGEGYSGAVPVISKGGRFGNEILKFPPTQAIDEMIYQRRGFIGVDELRNCPVIWQQALQALFEGREFGDQKLPVGVRLLACSNSAKVATGGRKLSGPLANRFTHVAWAGFEPKETLKYLLGNKGKFPQAQKIDVTESDYTQKDIEKITDEYWDAYFGQASIDIFGGFLVAKPQMKHVEPKPNSPEMDGPWPTTRAWTTAARWIATYRIFNDHTPHKIGKNTLRTVVEGTIGSEAADMLWKYLKARNLPSPEDFILGKTSIQLDPSVPDVAYTILASAANYVTNLKDSAERHKMAEQLYFKCAEATGFVGIEIALAGAVPLSDAFLARNSAGQTAWQKVFSKVAR